MKLTKNQKILALSAVIVLIAAIIYSYLSVKKRKTITNKIVDPGNDSGPFDPVTSPSLSNVVFPLKMYSGYSDSNENYAVKVVQRYLNKKIIDTGMQIPILNLDGKYGPKTEFAYHQIFGTKTVSYSQFKNIENEMRSSSPLYL